MLASLRARYTLVVVGVATIPVLLLGFFAGERSAAELERQSLILQRELAMRVEHEITSFVAARQNELRLFERTNVLVGMDPLRLSASMGGLLAHGQVYQEIVVMTADGRIRGFASRTNIVPRDSRHWSDARFAVPGFWDSVTDFVGPIKYDAVLREPLFDIAIPIISRPTDKPAGVLLGHVRFRPIWNLLADIDLPAGTDAFVVNGAGRILAHRSPAEVLSGRVFDLPPEDGRHSLLDDRPGLVVVQALSQVGESAFVVITRPLDFALASANEMRRTALLSAAVLLVAASLLALQQSSAIVRPVETLARAAQRISAGELDTSIAVSGPREIDALSRTLGAMTAHLRQTITDLERSEFAERQRAAVTLESIGDAVITTGPGGTVTFVNPVAADLTGWSRDDATGRPVGDVLRVVDEHSHDPVPDPVARCLAGSVKVEVAGDAVLIGRHGREFAVQLSAAPIRERGGDVVGAVVVVRDITEHKAMEATLRQSQKMEAIGQLTGGVAHDFNNLLQVIQGNAELLVENPLHDPELTTPILRASERGGELTKRLLSFARKQILMPRPVDVAQLVAGIQPMLERTLGEAIEVTSRVDADLGQAHADPGQLETALLNLALNARDAMRRGGRLVISCRNATTNDFTRDPVEILDGTEFVAIAVSDEGIGMDEETLRRAIDPFFTTKGVGEGSGLGLSMVYGFVMQTGGHLEIDSKVGAGTTATMFLPRSPAATEHPRSDGPPRAVSGQGETILIVEDDAEVRALTRRTLEDLGYRVIDAENAMTARHMLETRQDIDLVLSDVVLPGGVSGVELAHHLRVTRPNIPVALMSGYPEADSPEDSLAGQGILLLNKPFQRSVLARALRTLLCQPTRSG